MGRMEAGLFVLCFGCWADLSGQHNTWERQVQTQLNRAVALLPGSPHVLERKFGMLNGDDKESFPVRLEAEKRYSIIGVCDQDCADLSIIVVNEHGSELAIDQTRDNVPILQFTPHETMGYRIRIVMANCQVNPCWYGAAVITDAP